MAQNKFNSSCDSFLLFSFWNGSVRQGNSNIASPLSFFQDVPSAKAGWPFVFGIAKGELPLSTSPFEKMGNSDLNFFVSCM
jgi:hypothetical protein